MNLTEATIKALKGELNEARSHKEDNEQVAPRDNTEKRVGYVKNSPYDEKDVPKRAIYNQGKPKDNGSVWGRYDKDELDTYEKSTPDIERYKELKKDADAERSVAKHHNALANLSDDMASDIVRDKKLARAKNTLQGKQVFKTETAEKISKQNNIPTSSLIDLEHKLINVIMSTDNNELLDILQPMEMELKEYLLSKHISF